jgi:hypothetical protein
MMDSVLNFQEILLNTYVVPYRRIPTIDSHRYFEAMGKD